MLSLHQNKSLLNFKSGFSLLEVMLVLFIISFGFIFYISASQTTIINSSINHKTIAHQIITKKIESLKATTPSNWPQNGSFSDPLLDLLPQGQATLNISNFDSGEKLKKIKVDILWNERGQLKQHTEETLIYVP